MNWPPKSAIRFINFGTVLLPFLLVAGCASVPSGPAAARNGASPRSSSPQEMLEQQEIAKWTENLAFIEWQVARMAAGCQEAATSSQSSHARREASKLNASYALSSYALSSVPSVTAQVLSLAAMAELYYQVWVEEVRAATEFGEQSKPVEAAIVEIRERLREHATKYVSPSELRTVEGIVRAWRKAHPTVRDVDLIRFGAFAEQFARETRSSVDVGGMFGKITGEAHHMEFLGERLLLVMNRMPRLAEWQGEAFAASLLDEPEIVETFATLKQLGDLHPELKDALAQVQKTVERVQALEQSVRALETSVNSLDNHLTQLATSVHPDTLRQLTDHGVAVAWTKVRSTLLLTAACGAALLVLHALLRRWNNPPQPRS